MINEHSGGVQIHFAGNELNPLSSGVNTVGAASHRDAMTTE
jgi:hypothetical protein